MGREGEQINRLDGGGGIAGRGQEGKVAGEGFRVAGDIDDLGRGVGDEGAGESIAQTGTGRVDEDGVVARGGIVKGLDSITS